MKKGLYVLSILLIIGGFEADAQRRQIRKAEKAYADKEYQEVLERLEKAKDKGAVLSDALLAKKAIAHYKLMDKDQALSLFEKMETDNIPAEGLVFYGRLLQENTNYGDAVNAFNQAIDKGENSAKVKRLNASAEWASSNNFYMDGYTIEKSRLEINAASAGVQFYKNGLIYSKAEKQEKARRSEKDFSYSDMHYVPFKGDGFGTSRVFSNELKFPFSAGAVDFTENEQQMYFTKVVKGKGGEEITKIFRADYGSDEWHQDVKELDFNNDSYSCAMPALGPDDSYMVFASDMPGSQGGFDLYVVYKEGKNKWSQPRNLGEAINTPQEETFPFIDANENLYFASNGHKGFGGLDIFKSAITGNEFGEPENMMIPLNSGRDDFGLVLDPANPREGYLSSNRSSNGMYDQIYSVTLPAQGDETASSSSSDDDFLEATDEDGGSSELDDFLGSTGDDETKTSDAKEETDEQSAGSGDELDEFLQSATTEASDQEDNQEANQEESSGDAGSLEEAMQEAASGGENIVYRVQFFSSIKPLDRLKKFEPTGDYVYRYYYKDLYRYTIGEFYTPEPAIALKEKVQKLGYEDAFVAVFRDNERVIDVQVYDNKEENKEDGDNGEANKTQNQN